MPVDALIAFLRSDLRAAEFTVSRLRELWGDRADAALHRGDRVAAVRALDAKPELEAAAVFARLFVLGFPAALADLGLALPLLGVEGAVALELVRLEGELAVPLVDLRPYSFTDSWGEAHWWIASDLGEAVLGGALPEDHVLGVGGASLTLAGLMLETPAACALDLGTGCGIQALHASRHSGRVVATDISPRALRYARFNAALNDITNIEFRLGDLFEPVRGELFDHIVSNPPFVITPRVAGVPRYEYRDGGMVGDGLVSRVIGGLSEHLEPGGVAQLLGNWEYRDGVDAFDRVGSWLDDSGLDAWLIEREVQDAALYSETWIRDGGTRPGGDFDRLVAAWLEDFDRRGVESVGFGYLTLRQPKPGRAPTLRRLERLDAAVSGGLGGVIARALAAEDWLAEHDDEALARAMLTVASDVTEERHYWPGDEHPAAMTLRQGGGFARSYPLDTALAAIVGASDGELSVGAICAAVAELLGAGSGNGDPMIDEGALRGEVLPTIRELIAVGILTV